jgi:heptosyltransferase-3
VAKYISLIKWITSEHKLPVIITGSPDERERAEEIMKVCGNNNLSNLAGKTSIGMFAALLKACALFIGGDSAGIHIAAAVGTPTVGIFGPFSSAVWAPRGERHVTVQKTLPCVPCHQKGCHDSEVSRCLEELTVDEAKPVVNSRFSTVEKKIILV